MTAGCAVSVAAFAGAGFMVEALGPQGVYLLGAGAGVIGGVVMLPGLVRLRRTVVAEVLAGD